MRAPATGCTGSQLRWYVGAPDVVNRPLWRDVSASAAGQGIHLFGALGQRVLAPYPAAVPAAVHLAGAGGTVHPTGLTLVERDSEHGAGGLEAHVHPLPVHAPVAAPK